MKHRFFLLLSGLLLAAVVFAQPDSIYNQGVYRNYIVHLPTGYSPANEYPLVLNFHGLGSNALEQMNYSQMNTVADTAGFIVVYPNAIDSSWNITNSGTPDDVAFVTALVDSLRAAFSIGSCLFSTGMSQGGFMSYKLACAISGQITAIAVVSGNMPTIAQSFCTPSHAIPVMHFHGTADPVANYNGSTGVPPVETTVQWWANTDNCSTTIITTVPNTVPGDNCTAELYRYTDGDNGSEVELYKITGGGHTWPGAIPVPALGNTIQDIKASGLIWNFFHRYCGTTAGITAPSDNTFTVFPNPSNGLITIRIPEQMAAQTLVIRDGIGRVVATVNVHPDNDQTIDLAACPAGIYTISGTAESSIHRMITLVR